MIRRQRVVWDTGLSIRWGTGERSSPESVCLKELLRKRRNIINGAWDMNLIRKEKRDEYS